jgi:hypothetical protein
MCILCSKIALLLLLLTYMCALSARALFAKFDRGGVTHVGGDGIKKLLSLSFSLSSKKKKKKKRGQTRALTLSLCVCFCVCACSIYSTSTLFPVARA